MIFLVREVLRRADRLQAAIDMFRRGPRTCGYNFIVGSGDERQAVAIEVTRRQMFVAGFGDPAENLPPHSALIDAVSRMGNDTFIVATDKGIFHKMRELAPGKTLIEAPTAGEGATCESCAHCPWMAMNGLQNLVRVLETGLNEITIDESIRERAVVPVQRMLDFAAARRRTVVGDA